MAFLIKDREKQLSLKKQDICYLRQNIARYNYDTRVEDENLVAEQQDVIFNYNKIQIRKIGTCWKKSRSCIF